MTGTPALVVDEELARSTIHHLVGRVEAVALLIQAGSLAMTATVDRLLPDGRALLYGLAAAHVVLSLVVFRVGGPFRWGGSWAALWVGVVFLMPLVMAHLLAPTEYASSPTCVQLCSYPNGVLLILAFYPWLPFDQQRWRLVAEVGLILAIFAEHLLLMSFLREEVTLTNVTGVAAALSSNTLAYLAGKAVGQMCYRAARAQLKLQRDTYDEFANFLHSHVRGCLVAVHAESGDNAAVMRHLRELDRVVTRRRLEMLLVHDEVPLAAIFREHVGRFERAIIITDSPRIGALTVGRPVGMLLSRALGDLLSNATKHARAVRIGFAVDGDRAVLDLVDDGPGFAPSVLDNETTSLHGLRRDARRLGGDLVMPPDNALGAWLRLVVPLRGRGAGAG